MRKSTMAALALAGVFCLAGHGWAASGTITVYTSQPSDQMAEAVALFRKSQPDVTVNLYRSGTTEVMNKLQAEFTAGRPQADVVLIADAVAMTQLKNDGRLAAYDQAPFADLPPALVDPGHAFFGTKLITTGIVYNTKLVAQAPKSWNDLLAPEAAARTIMPHPLYSGAAVIHVGTLVQQPQFGWAYFETLAKRGGVAAKGNGAVLEAVARGEKAYGIIVEYMALNAKTKGSPVDFVFPSDGVTAVTQPVAILKTTANPEAAKAFVDWQLGVAAQGQSVGQGYFPVLPSVTPPAGYPPLNSLKILPVDLTRMLADDDENKRRFLDLFGG